MKYVLFCLFLAFWLEKVSAQQPPNGYINVIQPSPTAMDFQKYGNYSVSHFTGVPQISIPLYTIKEGDIEIPITLSYHASGIKPSDHDGIISAGWVLNTGGLVSRTIFDNKDETSSLPNPVPTKTYVENLTCCSPTLTDPILTYLKNNLEESQTYDTHPDLFSYDFLNQHGKFIFKDLALTNCMQLDYSSLAIQAGMPSAGSLQYFTVLDEKGRKFEFGNYPGYSGSAAGTNEWYLGRLNSAIDPQNKVGFSYETYSEFKSDRYDVYQRDDAENVPVVDRWDCDIVEPISNYMENWSGITSVHNPDNYYQARVPKQITFRNGKVVFTYDLDGSNNIKRLNGVEVYDLNNSLVLKIQLNIVQQWFDPTHLMRPFLKEIKFLDINSSVVNKYAFNYIQENTLLPSGANASVDFWGYCNGSISQFGDNSDLVPKNSYEFYPYAQSTYEVRGTNYRRTDAQLMQIYTLNEIIYPTGGKTVFEYEANYFPGTIPNYYPQHEVGGLRIKKITNYSANNTFATAKLYEYAGEQMDVLPIKDLFMHSDRYHILSAQTWERFRRVSISSHSSIPLTPHGSSVVYQDVTEYSLASSGSQSSPWLNNGSTTYFYDYTPFSYSVLNGNGLEGSDSYPLYKEYQHEFRPNNDGKLIGVTHRTAQGNTIKSESYLYEEISKDNAPGFIIDRSSFYISDPCPASNVPDMYAKPDKYPGARFPWNYGDVTFYSVWKRLKSVETVENGNLFVTTDYYYDNPSHIFPTSKKTKRSNGDEITTVLKYPFDFSSQSVYSEMLLKHRLDEIVETSTYKAGTQFLNSVRTSFDFWNAGSWGTTGVILPRSIHIKNAANAEYEAHRYNIYNTRGGLLEQQKKDDVKESYLWGYSNLYPVARIVGADYSTVAALINQSILDNTGGVYSDAQMRTELNKIRAGLVNTKSLVTTYTYKPLIGMTSQTDPNGRITYYEYDAFGRLELVRDHDGNILKKICYNYAGQPEECSLGTNPDWRNTSTAARCTTIDGSNTGEQEQEQQDMNPYSSTAGTTRWVVIGQNCSMCPKPYVAWEATGFTRCQLDGSGNNTGYREMLYRNMEPCGVLPYLSEMWAVYTQDLTNCAPPPPSCSQANCTGNDKKCINGVCETGVWTCVSSTRISQTVWRVTYRYKFSDDSYSTYYQEIDQNGGCFGPIEP